MNQTLNGEGPIGESLWVGDLFDRKSDALFLKNFLTSEARHSKREHGAYVLNLDSSWGTGKTFFFERFAKQLAADKFLVVSVNAWRDDHAEDPLLCVMAAIDKVVQPLLNNEKRLSDVWRKAKGAGTEIALSALKGAAAQLARKAVGSSVDEILHRLDVDTETSVKGAAEGASQSVAERVEKIVDRNAETMLAEFKRNQNSIQTFQKNLALLLSELKPEQHQLPMFVLIDELDRCRPPFAIALLERIKHLFETNNVVFVIATDTEQLQHSINAVYGIGFDSQRYLRRFFNRTYKFEQPKLVDFVKAHMLLDQPQVDKLSLPPKVKPEHFLAMIFEHFDLSLRDVSQCLDIFSTIQSMWHLKIKIEAILLMPLIIAYQKGMAIDLTGITVREIVDFAEKSSKRISSWRITFPQIDHGSHVSSKDSEGIAVFERMALTSLGNLPQISKDDTTDPLLHWINKRFDEEFALLYGRSWNSGDPPKSVMTTYPKLIRSAGRFLASSQTTK